MVCHVPVEQEIDRKRHHHLYGSLQPTVSCHLHPPASIIPPWTVVAAPNTVQRIKQAHFPGSISHLLQARGVPLPTSHIGTGGDFSKSHMSTECDASRPSVHCGTGSIMTPDYSLSTVKETVDMSRTRVSRELSREFQHETLDWKDPRRTIKNQAHQ